MNDRLPSRARNGREGFGLIPEGERVLVDDRPHIAFVFTQMWSWFVIGLIVWGAWRWIGIYTGQVYFHWAGHITLVLIGGRWILGFIDWIARRHVMTEARIIAKFGILRTVTTDLPLRRVQHTMLVRPMAERLFGIGSIGVSTAGSGGVDLVWRGIEHPERVMGLIREHVDRMSVHGKGKQVTPVIGIVGGIGSGKSSVARIFKDLGCAVSDSDESVREIMSTRSVIDELVRWWGHEILDAQGEIDRYKVSQIVFENEYERRRLEGLIHPMVHEKRRSMIEESINSGVEGVIIDAPLLFEAGVDAECDAVVFVDTPLKIRQARVQENRGWDPSELTKREKTQLGLEHKQKRSDYVVANTGSRDELRGRVARVLSQIQRDFRDRAKG